MVVINGTTSTILIRFEREKIFDLAALVGQVVDTLCVHTDLDKLCLVKLGDGCLVLG